MSKRAKLITTMCSLVVALCAFAFGVFAATKITYDMANSVTYHIKDALVKITRTIEYLTPTQLNIPSTKATVVSDTTGKTWTNASTITFQTYDENTGVWKDPQVSGDVTYSNNTVSDKINANFNNGYVYKVTVKISSVASTGVKVKFSIPEISIGNTFMTAGECTLTSGSIVTTERYLTYYMGILDLTTSIGIDIPFQNISLSIENTDYVSGVLLENMDSDYYYMYMGSYNGSPIEWRFVSTDGGATRYTYTAGQADSITGECVFVQNTYTKNMAFDADSNNYETSDIRAYIIGDMISELVLTNDATYAKVIANADVFGDKLWLLSEEEVENLFVDNNDRNFFNITNREAWWLRSPDVSNSDSACGVAPYGNLLYVTVDNTAATIRTAFKIAL